MICMACGSPDVTQHYEQGTDDAPLEVDYCESCWREYVETVFVDACREIPYLLREILARLR